MTEAMLFASKLSINGTVFEFVTHDIKESRELLLDDDGIRGTRSMSLERATQGLIKCQGTIKLNPTPLEMKTLWPLIAQNNTGTVLTDVLQDVTIVIDLQTASMTYVGRFTKAAVEGTPGKKLDVTLTFVGYSCTMGAGGVITGVGDITNRPYMMQDLGSGITIGGTAYSVDKFSFEIDNKIDPTFMQGQIATDLAPTGRDVTLGLQLKYTSTEAGLLTTAQTGPSISSPATASFAFTNGTNSMSFTMGAIVAPSNTVTATQKKLRLPLEYKCLRVGTTLEVVATFV